jgi:tetratricopeptide (TPR) repeat protein
MGLLGAGALPEKASAARSIHAGSATLRTFCLPRYLSGSSFSRSAVFLVLAIISSCNAAFAQKNANCFNAAMPPVDIISACDQNLASDPRDAQVYQARGVAWYRLNNYDQAIADFSQSINIDAKYIRAFYNRGLAWEKKGKLEEALKDYKYFANLDPSFPDAQRAIARVSAAHSRPLETR